MTKAKPKSKYLVSGRKTVVTSEVLIKLEQAFSLGCTDLEACLSANIGKTTLYKFLKENPEFAARRLELKEELVLQARGVVKKALDDDDSNTAKWLLERKKRDEFGQQPSTLIDLKVVNTAPDETLTKMLLGDDAPKQVINGESVEITTH